jgi:hypothetical protein
VVGEHRHDVHQLLDEDPPLCILGGFPNRTDVEVPQDAAPNADYSVPKLKYEARGLPSEISNYVVLDHRDGAGPSPAGDWLP